MQALAVQVPLPGSESRVVVAVIRSTPEHDQAEALLDRLSAIAAAAPAFHARHQLQRVRVDAGQFSSVLDLLALMNGQEKFVSACMMLVNELTSRLSADRVSLGWERRGYLRVKAISHMEKI